MKRLVSLLIVLASTASAQVPDLSRVEIRCADPGVRDQLASLVRSVIGESLTKLDGINRRVSDQLRARLASRQLIVECGGRDRLDARGAEAQSRPGFLGPYKILLGVRADGLKPTNDQKNTILHELLHYAKIDNFGHRAHNNAWDNDIVAEDNVYACAEVVYPGTLPPTDFLLADETCAHALGAGEEN